MNEEPTPQFVRNALPLLGGRVSVALDEIIRKIKVYLPPVIDDANTRLNLKIQKPTNIRIAPSDIESIEIDEILIDFSTETNANGSGVFTDKTTILIHSIDERIVQGRHVQQVQDRADLIRAILYADLTHGQNPQGQEVWAELVPLGKRQLPGEWSKYSGATLEYRLVQSGANLWN